MLLLALIGALVVSITITLGRTATCQSMAQTYPAPQPQKYVNLSTCIHSLPVCTLSFGDGYIYIAEVSGFLFAHAQLFKFQQHSFIR